MRMKLSLLALSLLATPLLCPAADSKSASQTAETQTEGKLAQKVETKEKQQTVKTAKQAAAGKKNAANASEKKSEAEPSKGTMHDATALVPDTSGSDFKSPFNGKDFTGWKKVGGGATYQIEGDTIVGKWAPAPILLCVPKRPIATSFSKSI